MNSFNVLNVSNHYSVADDRSEILTWLSPLEPRIRHQDIRTRRADNVGGWLLQTDEFRRWCDGAQEEESEYATLFCCGDPAVGKTYFSSLVIDRLCDRAKEENIAVACFYVDFAARDEQTPTNMLGSLLKQIVGGLERIPDDVSRTFQDYNEAIGRRRLRMPEIVKMLQTVTSLQPTFICVDALDECVEGHRPEVLNSLRQILEKSPDTRIFLTGRRHIRSEIERHLGGRMVVLSIKPNYDDIVGYIRMRLSKDTSLDAMDSGLEAEIIKTIGENIPKTFIQISLTMDAILGGPTAYDRRRELRAMTDSLDLKDVYGTTLERINELGGEKARLGIAVLMWISHSERLLQLDELLHALAVEIGSTDLDSERIPSVETLLSCSLGLVVIDKEASVVRLVHFTLQEHLCTYPDLFGATHSIMAETCLTYLNFRTIKDILPTIFVPPQSTPFLQYSSLCWGIHARRDASKDVVSLALKLFSHIETHISTKLLLVDLVSRAGRCNRDIPVGGHLIGFTGLHCASVFGIVGIAATLVGRVNCNLNKRDFLGITPLIWAAICGREEVAGILLEKLTVIPDKPDKCFRRTALSWAAWKGHVGIVRILLGRASAKPGGTDGRWAGAPRVINTVLGRGHVNPDWRDIYGQTPISLAATQGREGVVKLLAERGDVNVNRPDENCETPLLSAADSGCEEVVRLLLGRKDVKPDIVGKDGRTPLLLAVKKGHDEVVRLLLERQDVNPDRQDEYARTPLWWASQKGHEGVVRLLVEREDISINKPDKNGETPLSSAANGGYEGVVKLLLGRQDINPNMPGKGYQTPLVLASEKGHEGVVKLLLGREDIEPEKSDLYFRTPLLEASHGGHEGVVKLLLEREDINPNTADLGGNTPLSGASVAGHEVVVRLLLGRKDIDLNSHGGDGRTPLALASWGGHESVVRLLLEQEGVDSEMLDRCAMTPLAWASLGGHEGVVKLLLGRKDINPNTPDDCSRTPLSLASGGGHEGVVQLLLGREDVEPERLDQHAWTPLLWASFSRHAGVVDLLLERKDINPNKVNKAYQTPLLLASKMGYEEVVKLLLGRKDTNPNMPNNDGQTPLSLASEEGHDGVVKLLLEREDVNPNTPDNGGQTPLLLAARDGRNGVVKLLLERKDVNSNITDNGGQTPLSWGAEYGHDGVVKLLLGRKDINLNRRDNTGRTPLWFACWRGRVGVIKLLLECEHVNPNLPNKDGLTPLSLASQKGYERVVKLLQAHESAQPDTV